MPLSPPTRRRAGRAPSPAGPGRDGIRSLEHAFETARASRDARDRLRAGALDALLTFIPAAVALAFRVEANGTRDAELALAGPLRRRVLERAVPQLARLEAIDPFAIRHAQAARARVLSVADVGGPAVLARTLYGRHLARRRLRAPLFAYFWHGDRIVAGVALLRTTDEPEFDAAAARLLGEIQPLLEDALTGPAHDAPATTSGLTAREREIAGLVATGASDAAIALALGGAPAIDGTGRFTAVRHRDDPLLLPYGTAAASGEPAVRLKAHALAAVVALVPATLAVLIGVDRRSEVVEGIALQSGDLDFSVAEAWRRYLHQTVGPDPFAAPRVPDPAVTVMLLADLPPAEARAHRTHLAAMGLADRATVHVRAAGHVVASILLLRGPGSAPFSARDAAALRHVQPVLEQAYALAGPAR